MNVDDFIKLEVQHQGFDLEMKEGQQRVEWMQEAWEHAENHGSESPTIIDVEYLGALIERVKNRDGLRRLNVRVGSRICPMWEDVPYLLAFLMKVEPLTEEDCLEHYRLFEIIHPFEDGNGRVGKVLYSWWLDVLDDPEMPPDLFGGGVP